MDRKLTNGIFRRDKCLNYIPQNFWAWRAHVHACVSSTFTKRPPPPSKKSHFTIRLKLS